MKHNTGLIRILLTLQVSVFLAGNNVTAQVKLPQLIRDSMILQRDQPLTIWGWASAKEKINIHFNGKSYRTKADQTGNWAVQLPAMKAGGPYQMDIVASNTISLKEILFGDVWFCSGQSNMVHQLNIHDVTYANEIAKVNYPLIRQCWIPAKTSLTGPQQDLPPVHWTPAVGETVRQFSAVAYFFAKELYLKYKIPIGIINASVGGTPIEAWISEPGFKNLPEQLAIIEKNKDTGYINSTERLATGYPAKTFPDAGLTEAIKWYAPEYQPKGWRNINVPGYWEDQGLNNLNGTVWYRKIINIPASFTGKAAGLYLGRIVDADEVYINGKPAGKTGYQYPQRRYKLPAGLLQQGNNTIVVRVTNNGGKGGFVPDKPYCIFAGNDTVDLKGTWQYKVGSVFVPTRERPVRPVDVQQQPTALYNAMVAPYIQYGIKGICWYQGESNTGAPKKYRAFMEALINDWRTKWKMPTLPFLYVQLPGLGDYNYLPSESNWAVLRDAQLKTLSIPNTAMVVAIDLGEWNDIHPDNKKDVGLRLALAAKKMAYKEDIVYSGPIYQSAVVEGNRIRISFTNSGSGLVTNDGEAPASIAIAGADKQFVWATASIEGNQLIVWNGEILNPVYVRYAWAENPANPNLYNKEGLPASPFSNLEE